MDVKLLPEMTTSCRMFCSSWCLVWCTWLDVSMLLGACFNNQVPLPPEPPQNFYLFFSIWHVQDIPCPLYSICCYTARQMLTASWGEPDVGVILLHNHTENNYHRCLPCCWRYTYEKLSVNLSVQCPCQWLHLSYLWLSCWH